MLRTTLGQLLLNEALPRELRDYTRQFDKPGSKALFSALVERYPDRYREISKALMDIGRDAAYTSGGDSFGLEHLGGTPAVFASRHRLNRRIHDILSHDNWDEDKKQAKIIEAASVENDRLRHEILEETEKAGNPLADQVRSGSRGNPLQLKRLIGGDTIYVDHRENPIPFPVQRSYSEGLAPADWFAASFGARKGLADTKFATQHGGFFAKQLNQLAHRLIVVGDDDDDDKRNRRGSIAIRGMPAMADDPDNEGALLAHSAGGYPRNTVLTPKILADLRNKKVKRILVRSPTVGGPRGGGVYSRDVGYRDRGTFPNRGELVGLTAAQALTERLTQGQLGSRHAGGLKGASKAVSGFDYINQLVQVPKRFKGGAAHAQKSGRVESVKEAPAGGYQITVDGVGHYVAPGFDLVVKKGDVIEEGDILSDGIPNPAEIVKHKGVGEGRRYLAEALTKAFRESGMPAHRRNAELMARGLIDHVEMLDETDDYVPGDIVSYSDLERDWQPRIGYNTVRPKQAVGKYLERPVLHYSVGTKIQPSMVPTLQEFGVTQMDVHDEAPPFQPTMIRAMAISQHDPDFLTRMLGSNQKKSLLHAVHRGGTSTTTGTSFVPSLAEGVDFGKKWPQDVLKPPANK
jgi:DNA-directed RNA polymerase subunit beta'